MPRTPIPALASAPIVNLAPRDVEALVEELQAYHAIFSPLFRRREQRAWGLSLGDRAWGTEPWGQSPGGQSPGDGAQGDRAWAVEPVRGYMGAIIDGRLPSWINPVPWRSYLAITPIPRRPITYSQDQGAS
jgi:hypothetical protein